MNSIIAWLTGLLKGVVSMAASFFAGYFKGKGSEKRKKAEKDAKVLKRQRDNDVHTVEQSDSVWMRWRK